MPDGPLSGLGEKGTAMDTIEPFWEESKERLQRWWLENMGCVASTPSYFNGFHLNMASLASHSGMCIPHT